MTREKLVTRTPERQMEGYDPWTGFRDVERMLRDWVRPRWSTPPLASYTEGRPPVDLRETEKELILSAQMPGMTKDDIDIDVTYDSVSICGERKTEEEKPGEKYHFRELTYGSFCASYSLPVGVKPDKVAASYKDGILEVTMPKAEVTHAQKVKVA
jgi:HSP20 family protein